MNYHVPVLLNESIDGLQIKTNGIYVDVTFGGGGHSQEILKKIGSGRLFGFDQDKDAVKNSINDERFTFVLGNFKYLNNYLKYHNVSAIDGLIADLGISSHHIDTAERGFAHKLNGPLDMRMSQTGELTAALVLNTYDELKLQKIFFEWGELDNAKQIVRAILKYRANNVFTTIQCLKNAIAHIVPQQIEQKIYSKIFQAIRIEVNQEMDALQNMLNASTQLIKKGGRLVVITYHSIEDRIVKNFIKAGNFSGDEQKDFYGNKIAPFKAVNKKIILPSPEEIETNNRARSAKLRIAERV